MFYKSKGVSDMIAREMNRRLRAFSSNEEPAFSDDPYYQIDIDKEIAGDWTRTPTKLYDKSDKLYERSEDMGSVRHDSEQLDILRKSTSIIQDIIDATKYALLGQKYDPDMEVHIQGKNTTSLVEQLNGLTETLLRLEMLLDKPRLSDYEGG